jgi:predicted acylesterase/phospholipase RssA
MDITGKILTALPLFRHCLTEEIIALQKIGNLASVKKGHEFDLKKINSFNVIVSGIFEIESMGKTDVVYLAPGSFFGTVPFTESRVTGKIKALVDSTLLIFKLEDMYKFFLMSYKCLRGYLKVTSRMGFDISEIGIKYFGGKSKIITVYGPSRESGKSLLASLLTISLKKDGKTVLLDTCISGNSIFNYFEKKITAPLSQRSVDGSGYEQIINEWIVPVDESLDLINITFGSKVKANPDILSPLLFILSKEYKYIVIDSSDDDIDLRNRIFGLSDQIFNLVKNRKEIRLSFDVFDGQAKEGQRVYYVINERYAGQVRDFSGGFVLPHFESKTAYGEFDRLSHFAESVAVSSLVGLIMKKRRAIVFETNLLPALFYAGFLNALREKDKKFDIYYTSSFSYIIVSLFLLSSSQSEFKKWLEHFFSEDRINKLLDITFPTDHVFKNNLIAKLADEICGSNRIEMLNDVPVAILGQNGAMTRRLFSTGHLKDLLAASFCLYPVFEQVPIMDTPCNSGYPDFRVRIEDLFRIDVDETVYVSVDNSSAMNYPEGKLISLFNNYMAFVEDRHVEGKTGDFSDINIVLEVSERDIKIGKILDTSRELADKFVSSIT